MQDIHNLTIHKYELNEFLVRVVINMLIEFLISALVLVVVIYVIKLILDMIPLPSQVKTIAWIVIGLIVLLLLLQWFGIYDSNLNIGR